MRDEFRGKVEGGRDGGGIVGKGYRRSGLLLMTVEWLLGDAARNNESSQLSPFSQEITPYCSNYRDNRRLHLGQRDTNDLCVCSCMCESVLVHFL